MHQQGAAEADILEQAMRLPCWHAPQDASILGGGITNHNVLITDQGRQFVVRMGQDIPLHGILRSNELAVSRAAHAAGLAPAVHHAGPGVLVLDYIAARPLTPADVQDPARLEQLADLLARVHRDVTAALSGPVMAFWVFHVLRDYARSLRAMASPHLPLLPELAQQAEQMEEMVGPIRLVLGHNDLLPGNILWDGTRHWLIDWEYAGFNSGLFDLGGLASNNGLDIAAETRLLAAYHGHEPDSALWRQYRAMKCASLLRETMWSMLSELTSVIDFDYAAYSATNLAAYRAAFADLKDL